MFSLIRHIVLPKTGKVKVGQRMKSIYCESEQNHGLVSKACCCHMPYAFLRHIIFNTTKEMMTHFGMLREIFMHFLYVAREVYAFFLTCRGKVNPRALSGKFLRMNSCYPESFRFLCLLCNSGVAIFRLGSSSTVA